jgi:hypothetical protein
MYSCLNYLSCEFPTAIQTTILEFFLYFSILYSSYAFLFYSYVFSYSCVLDSYVPKELSKSNSPRGNLVCSHQKHKKMIK